MCLFIIINDLEPIGVLNDDVVDNIENPTDNDPKNEISEKIDTNNVRSEIIEIKEKLPCLGFAKLASLGSLRSQNEEELPFDDEVNDQHEKELSWKILSTIKNEPVEDVQEKEKPSRQLLNTRRSSPNSLCVTDLCPAKPSERKY